MSHILRSVLVLTTASITAGFLAAPGTAYAADTTTKLSAAGMAADLKRVSSTSMATAKDGWRATMSFKVSDRSATGRYVVDPAARIASDKFRVGDDVAENYAVAGKGIYTYTSDPVTRAAVTMMGRASVRYVFTPQAVKLDTYVKDNMPSPSVVLTEDVNYAGTKIAHDDGSRDYAFKADDGVTARIHVNPAGVMTTARATGPDLTMSLAYTYGAQHQKAPAAAVTVDAKTLATAVAYLDMPASVKDVANQAATHTRRAAKGKTVKVAPLRTIVRRDATAFNSGIEVKMMKVSHIAGGARVSATNPWTHKTVSYTVKASGTKVLVAKG
jgi:hypothetical protein